MKNEPAFPFMHFDLAENEHGMTLRDYFAAKAMQAMTERREAQQPFVARQAYLMADAMLIAREA